MTTRNHLKSSLSFLLTSVTLCLTLTVQASTKETAGFSEIVTIMPDNIRLDAKFDTGADSSSLDARNIELFTKDGKDWVRFELTRTLNKKPYTLEYPVSRTTKIVSRVPVESSEPGKSHHRRPVIDMDICIGDQHKTIEVNLFDRSNFKYPFLLGASGLSEFDFVVDVEFNHLLPRECTVAAAK